MWCMLKKIKVHLGYWLAHSCHKIAHHPARHLYACHLVGAYFIRNIMPRMVIPVSSIEMCKDPEWFDITYFADLGLVERDGDAAVLCKADQSREESEEETSREKDEPEELVGVSTSPEKALPTVMEQKTHEKLVAVKPCSSKEKVDGTKEKWQRVVEFMMNKFSEADERKREFMELQNENLTKALSLIERMTDLAEAQTKAAQQLLASTSIVRDSQPQQASLEATLVQKLKDKKGTTTTSQPPSGVKRTRRSDSSGSQRDNYARRTK